MADGEEGQAAEAGSPTSDAKGRRSKQWHGQRKRRKSSTSDGRKPLVLKRTPGETGIFTNRMAHAIDKASEKQQERYNSEEARAERQKRHEERQKAREERRAKRAEERAKLAEEEGKRREEREAARKKAAEDAEAAATAEAAAAAEAAGAADASEAPSATKSSTRSRRGSHASSRPSMIRRMTTGESDIDGPLLWFNAGKTTEKTSQPLASRHSRPFWITQTTASSSEKRPSRKKSDAEEPKPSEEEKPLEKEGPKHSHRSRKGPGMSNVPFFIIARAFKESCRAAFALP